MIDTLQGLASLDWARAFLMAPPILGLLGIGAAAAFIAGRLGLIPVAYALLARVAAVVAVLWIAFSLGYRAADRRADVDALRAENQALQRDLTIQREATQIVAEAHQRIEAQAATMEQRIAEYAAELDKLGSDDRCMLTDDDLRWLRRIPAR